MKALRGLVKKVKSTGSSGSGQSRHSQRSDAPTEIASASSMHSHSTEIMADAEDDYGGAEGAYMDEDAGGYASGNNNDANSSSNNSSNSTDEDDTRPGFLSDDQLDLNEGIEKEAYEILKTRTFEHTRIFADDFMEKTGMNTDFKNVWQAVGWTKFAHIPEKGCRLLTIQFLCTLRTGEEGITFRFLGNEHALTWKDLSVLLGFSKRCAINLETVISGKGYIRDSFWSSISGEAECSAPRTNNIHNPTLHLMHKWIAMTIFPRADVRTIRNDEMMILYAMVKKIKISPVKIMIEQWLGVFRRVGNVECTSLVTRIFTKMGFLRYFKVQWLPQQRVVLDDAHFIQGHLVKHALDRTSLIMTYREYTTEIPLPAPELWLYKSRVLTLSLERREAARRSSVSGRMTRSRSRMERQQSQQAFEQQAGGVAPGWEQPPAPTMAGGSNWQQAGSEQWGQPHEAYYSSSSSGPPPFGARRSFSARGIGDMGRSIDNLSTRMGGLEVRTERIDNTLTQHVQATNTWRQLTYDELQRMNTAMQQGQTDLNAYFRYQGFDPRGPQYGP